MNAILKGINKDEGNSSGTVLFFKLLFDIEAKSFPMNMNIAYKLCSLETRAEHKSAECIFGI